ncbi:MauE/DoxX family redox-associated membrane protein [Paenibacillus dendritiformis]|uniref:MauE/DoxX family redox-associated membrane protein n=1 Tax=Paenibacillus dendritiformis TaxID=130049 RepID=UPI003667BFCB
MALVFMFQNVLAFLFLSTFLHKTVNYREHIRIMNAYHIVPVRFIVPSFILFAAAELAIGFSIFLYGITLYHVVSIGLQYLYLCNRFQFDARASPYKLRLWRDT